MQVCNGPALGLFTATELELLICGLPHLDFDALEAAAKYEGYSRWVCGLLVGVWSAGGIWGLVASVLQPQTCPSLTAATSVNLPAPHPTCPRPAGCRDDPVVRWFWQTLHGFNLDQKRAWLQVGGRGGAGLVVPEMHASPAWAQAWAHTGRFLIHCRTPGNLPSTAHHTACLLVGCAVHHGQRPSACGRPGAPAAADSAVGARHRAPAHRPHLLQRPAAARWGRWLGGFLMHTRLQRSAFSDTSTSTRPPCYLPPLLPLCAAEYASKEKLRQKLLLAIGWAQGFGLK